MARPMDPGALARTFARRAEALTQAHLSGLKKALVAVNRAQIRNLSGSNTDAPGSYPVPNRTGFLMRSAGWEIKSGSLGIVYNSAGYAYAIHSGNMTTKEGVQYAVRPRPFLDDAVDKTDAFGIYVGDVERAVLA